MRERTHAARHYQARAAPPGPPLPLHPPLPQLPCSAGKLEASPPFATPLQDDVPEETKVRRLQELIAAYRGGLHARGAAEAGRRHLVLVEGRSRRSEAALTGRTDTFKRVVFEDLPVPAGYGGSGGGGGGGGGSGPLVCLQPGDYVAVQVERATGGTLFARPLARTTLREFVTAHGSCAPLQAFCGP